MARATSSSSWACAWAASDSSRPGQHPGELQQPAGLVESGDTAAGHGTVAGLAYDQVLVGEGRHLRQVGDHEHLSGAGQRSQPRADLDGGAATDACVDLVEHQGRHRVGSCQHHLDREHHPGQLTSRGALLQRPRRRAHVRAQQHLDLVDAMRRVGEVPPADQQSW